MTKEEKTKQSKELKMMTKSGSHNTPIFNRAEVASLFQKIKYKVENEQLNHEQVEWLQNQTEEEVNNFKNYLKQIASQNDTTFWKIAKKFERALGTTFYHKITLNHVFNFCDVFSIRFNEMYYKYISKSKEPIILTDNTISDFTKKDFLVTGFIKLNKEQALEFLKDIVEQCNLKNKTLSLLLGKHNHVLTVYFSQPKYFSVRIFDGFITMLGIRDDLLNDFAIYCDAKGWVNYEEFNKDPRWINLSTPFDKDELEKRELDKLNQNIESIEDAEDFNIRDFSTFAPFGSFIPAGGEVDIFPVEQDEIEEIKDGGVVLVYRTNKFIENGYYIIKNTDAEEVVYIINTANNVAGVFIGKDRKKAQIQLLNDINIIGYIYGYFKK